MICKWTGKPICRLAEQVGTSVYGAELNPFACCDDDVAMEKMHCTCQPSVMGYLSREEYLKDKKGEIIQKELGEWN